MENLYGPFDLNKDKATSLGGFLLRIVGFLLRIVGEVMKQEIFDFF